MSAPETFPDSRTFLKAFARIGLLSFGGPAAQIALMHKVLVDEKGWLGEKQFLGALSFCMLLPGPEAMQLATYTGWRLRGTLGGLVAGLLFIIPGALVIFALAYLYINYGTQPLVQLAFLGVKAAVITIVLMALRKFASKALTTAQGCAIAAAAFVAFFGFGAPYPLIILAAALAGTWAMSADKAPELRPSVAQPRAMTLRTMLVGTLLWLAPLGLLWLVNAPFLLELGGYFSRLALFSFGGAYALLGWMTQTVVQDYGWITTNQMIDALGLAETTPGPLILVTQFVGHLAGYAQGGFGLMLTAGLLTLWMTFVPCFIWIFAGAPYLEHLLAQPRLQGALTGITAAVTGVIASISLWFAISVLLHTQDGSEANWLALGLVVSGALIHWQTKGSMLALLAGNATLAVLLGLALGVV